MEERYDLLSRARPCAAISCKTRTDIEEIYRRVQPVDEDERQHATGKDALHRHFRR